ncbi:DUF6891 domain-containing protein [Streptomyces sp. NPDC054904]|uniref:DUF6891 domain-containing protein n=1 Tax=unclassified Streptomyces TaxID=2593676 RepID=UPI0024820B85|nr:MULTISPECIES: hypothetical protein [unclassified Streptomyces]MDA5285505.1 hypothetical protein [Streptomyces sp. Isolate_45]MDX2395701.1 hypothetical protein [Streptomyces sp. DK15]
MLPVKIHTERAESYERPAAPWLSELVERIGADGDRFLVVNRIPDEPDAFVQVWHEAGGEYQLEHRAGSPDRHFQAFVPTAAEAARVMLGWARQEEGWDLGPAWERLDFPVEEAPPLDAGVEEELTGLVRERLLCGYDDRATLAEYAGYVLGSADGGGSPVSPAQARLLVDRLWRERVAEQAGWEGETDPERLTRAFGALGARGITAREDFACCRACGLAEIGDAGEEDARGFVFFHSQCTQGVAAGHDLWLLYGGFESGDELTVSVGREVVAALDGVGLKWVWDGSAQDAVRVTGLDWRKRLIG